MEVLGAHKKGVRIVVVGDRGTGKSTLIQTAVSESFPPNVDPVLPPTLLPDDMFPDRVPVTVIDTSVEQRSNLEEELRRADAIVLTYACDRLETRDRLSSYWLPEIRQLEVRAPVIVVGCRSDLKNGGKVWKLDYAMSPLMHQFSEIDACVECSAYKYIQIPEVFCYAKKAVLYPTPPLFDQEIQSLRPQFVNALKRIFILCDHDKDGSLNDAELNEFQVKCFNAPLKNSQIIGLKKCVEAKLPKGVDESGLTLRGFLLLHTLLIKKWRLEIVWTVLRRFGYKNDVRLDDNLLPPLLKGAPDQSVELTNVAVDYLKRIFSEHEKNGFLQPSHAECLFSTAPDCPWHEGPYKDAAPMSKFGFLNVDGFLSEWVLMTLLDPAKSLEYLKYLTYDGDASSAVRLTRRRLTDRKERQSQRNVYQGFVFGPKKAGKSALLDAFLERRFSDRYHSNTEERYAVNLVDGSLGSKKFLVLREIPEDKVQKLLSDEESLAACDVAIFVYDSSDEDSWKKAADLLMEVAGHGEDTGYEVPCLIVAAKADMNQHPVETHNSTRVSQDMGIQAPVPIKVKSGELNDIFRTIVKFAEHPHLNIPVTEAGRSRKKCHQLVDSCPSQESGNKDRLDSDPHPLHFDVSKGEDGKYDEMRRENITESLLGGIGPGLLASFDVNPYVNSWRSGESPRGAYSHGLSVFLDGDPHAGVLGVRFGYGYSGGYEHETGENAGYVDDESNGGSDSSASSTNVDSSSDFEFICSLPDWDASSAADDDALDAGNMESNDKNNILTRTAGINIDKVVGGAFRQCDRHKKCIPNIPWIEHDERDKVKFHAFRGVIRSDIADEAARYLGLLQRTSDYARPPLNVVNRGVERLIQVFSVRINRVNDSDSKNCCDIYGTISALGGFIYLFNRRQSDCESISPYDDTLCLTGHTNVLCFGGYFELILDLKDKGGALFPDNVDKRRLSYYSLELERYRKFDYGKHMLKEFHGNFGSATVYYTIFNWAYQARVKVEVVEGDQVYGLIVARYSGYEYSTDEQKKYYQTVLFYRPKSNYVKVKLWKSLPLSRSLVAVPTSSSLIIVANLWSYNGLDRDVQIAESELEFPVQVASEAVKYTGGDGGLARVTVAFSSAC